MRYWQILNSRIGYRASCKASGLKQPTGTDAVARRQVHILRLAIALTITVGASWPIELSAQDDADDEAFSRTRIGGWDVQAETTSTGDVLVPRIERISCFAQSEGAVLTRDRNGQTTLDFRDRDGQRHHAFNTDLIVVDGRKYKAKAVSVKFSDRFENVAYPNECGNDGCIVIDDPSGYLAAEVKPGVWLPMSSLLSEVIAAKSVSIRYRKRKEDCGGRLHCSIYDPVSDHTWTEQWTKVDVSRLADVVRWCDAAMQSPQAFQYRESMK